MTPKPTVLVNLVKVRGTELLASDTREQYRQKLARITLDSMVQFVGLLDAAGTVLEINYVALNAVGIALSDVEGQPFWTTFWWQVSDEINATLRDSILRASKGEFVRWDTEIYGRFGGKETIIIDASLMPVKDEQGNVVFIAAEGRDITEKKAHEREIARQREELAKLDELKTQFFANISHEFRTPLTLMMGPLEDALAKPEGLSDSNRERLELAHRNSLRLLKLVNTLLDFSRIEAGRIQASYQPTDLGLLTTELASVFRSAIERAGMRLVINCPTLPDLVYIDREMWEKVVLNLLSNAFKFTFEGEIEISLRVFNSSVEMQVRDTGTGIPADEIPKVFERFHRVQGARGRSYEGSGIGLALVQELVRLHGGDVRVESEVNQGSTFTVTIPLGSDHLPADRVGCARTLASTGVAGDAYLQEALRWLPERQDIVDDFPEVPSVSSSGDLLNSSEETKRTSRVLLADDNADMREYVQRLLRKEYEVVAVADGESALRSARERRPDLILADIMMPGLDGFGLLQAVRTDRDLKGVPLILLSARAGEESRVEGLEAGADDYLVKPFSARELVARVRSNIATAKIRHESAEQFRTLSERLDAEVRVRTKELEERGRALLKKSEEMRVLSRRLLQAQDEERRHIARELHDSAGQTLTVLSMNLAQLLQETRHVPDITESAKACEQSVRQLSQEIRTTSYLLHPPLLDETGLVSAISWYAQGLSDRSGIRIELRIADDFGRVPRDIELVVFRLIQECLTNIHRHSGAKNTIINIVRLQNGVSVEISDDGRGMTAEKLAEVQIGGSGVGIGGMRERVRQFQGDMKIESAASGTKILVNIPVVNHPTDGSTDPIS